MADTRTIEIVVKTDKAQDNVNKLGNEIKKTGEEAKSYQSQIGDNAKSTNAFTSILKRGVVALAGAAAIFKTLNAAIQSNTQLAQMAARTQAELSAVVDVVISDIGDLIAGFTNLNSETSLVDAGVNILLQGFTFMSRAFGVVTADADAYAIKLEEATAAARELSDIQFRLSERLSEQQINVEQARQILEQYRMESREIGATELERVQAMMNAREAANELYQEQLQLLNIRREEANAIMAAAAGSEAARQAKIELNKIEAEEIRLKTQNIQLTNTLLERTNSMINNLSKTTEESEEFDMSIFAGNKIIQQRNEVLVTWGEIERAATAELERSIAALNEKNAVIEENAEAQEKANQKATQGVNIASQAVDLFKDGFSIRGLFSVLASAAQFIPGFGGAIGAGLNLIGGLFRHGGVIPKYATGGLLQGPSHANGGIKYALGGNLIELEGGEGVINKRNMSIPWIREMASNLNSYNGNGVKFANGGITPNMANAGEVIVPVLVTDDLNKVQNRTRVIEDIATI